jgi:hypothetical protein
MCHHACIPGLKAYADNMDQNSTAILIIFFNRSDILYRQLISLKKFEPAFLYFAADGPRNSNQYDLNELKKCKELISQIIDWRCSINFYYSENNFGCDIFVPMAINWFFSCVDHGIILEDDCLISREFYSFATHLLEKYAHDERVMNISASNFQKKKWGDGDYYFSRYPANWGWASWRRAWQKYDPKIEGLDQFIGPGGQFKSINLKPQERRYWFKFLQGLQSGKYTFWDAKWLYAIWKSNGVSIAPNCNLSTNIGFGETATHTKERLQTHGLPIHSLAGVIKDPQDSDIQTSADYYLYRNFYKPSFVSYCKAAIFRIKKIIK